MSNDREHLNLLGVFHYVVGGLTALFSSIFIIHIFMGLAIVSGSFGGDFSKGPPAQFGWFFVIFPGMIVLLGWTLAVCTIVAGRKLQLTKNRIFCLVIAAIQCMFVPFGTVLGVFTIVVLMKDSVIAMFGSGDTVHNNQ